MTAGGTRSLSAAIAAAVLLPENVDGLTMRSFSASSRRVWIQPLSRRMDRRLRMCLICNIQGHVTPHPALQYAQMRRSTQHQCSFNLIHPQHLTTWMPLSLYR